MAVVRVAIVDRGAKVTWWSGVSEMTRWAESGEHPWCLFDDWVVMMSSWLKTSVDLYSIGYVGILWECSSRFICLETETIVVKSAVACRAARIEPSLSLDSFLSLTSRTLLSCCGCQAVLVSKRFSRRKMILEFLNSRNFLQDEQRGEWAGATYSLTPKTKDTGPTGTCS